MKFGEGNMSFQHLAPSNLDEIRKITQRRMEEPYKSNETLDNLSEKKKSEEKKVPLKIKREKLQTEVFIQRDEVKSS